MSIAAMSLLVDYSSGEEGKEEEPVLDAPKPVEGPGSGIVVLAAPNVITMPEEVKCIRSLCHRHTIFSFDTGSPCSYLDTLCA